MSSTVDEAAAALRSGRVAIVPTDTVYGLAADPESVDAVRELSHLKRRAESQPIALVGADLEQLVARIPELQGRSATIAGALLPGPYTLVLAKPGRTLRLARRVAARRRSGSGFPSLGASRASCSSRSGRSPPRART